MRRPTSQTALQALQDLRRHASRTITEAEQQNVADPPRAGDARADRRHGRAEDGAAGTVHPGGHDAGVRHQQHLDASGCRGTSTTRTCGSVHVGDKVGRCGTRRSPTTFHGVVVVHRRHARSGDAHDAGADRDAEPATACSRRTCSSTSSIHDKTTRDVARRADRRGALRRAELSVRLRAGRAGQVRAAAGEARRPAGRRDRGRSTASRKATPVVSQGSVFLQFANTYQG